MARGNQREISCEKNLKKQAAQKGGSNREGTKLQRDEEDKAKLQAKIKAKQERLKDAEVKEAEQAKTVVVKKKVKKKEADSLDDLLNAGLSGAAKKGAKKK